MEQNDRNPDEIRRQEGDEPAPGMGGAANTPSFGDEPHPGALRSTGGVGGAEQGGGGELETRQVVEETREIVAREAQRGVEETTERVREAMGDQAHRMADAVRHDAQHIVQDRMEAMRNRVEEQLDRGRELAAGGMEGIAHRIDEMADERMGGGGIRGRAGTMAHSAADSMEQAAGYLREHDAHTLLTRLEDQVRERPLESVLMGVAVGWLIGKILR